MAGEVHVQNIPLNFGQPGLLAVLNGFQRVGRGLDTLQPTGEYVLNPTLAGPEALHVGGMGASECVDLSSRIAVQQKMDVDRPRVLDFSLSHVAIVNVM